VINLHIETEHFKNNNTKMNTINSFKKGSKCMISTVTKAMKVSSIMLKENKMNMKMTNSFETFKSGTLKMKFLKVNRVNQFKSSNSIRLINQMVDLK